MKQNKYQNIAEFIQAHRAELDFWEPPEKLWEKLVTQLDKNLPLDEKLVNFISNHREAFEAFELPENIWPKIEECLNKSEMALEDFIRQNQDEFSELEAPADLWANIEGKLEVREEEQGTQIESFITLHQSELEFYEAPLDLWEKISEKLPKEKKQEKIFTMRYTQKTLLRIAAVVLLMITTGLGIWVNIPSQTTAVAIETEVPNIETVSSELAEAEAFYTSQINDKKQEIQGYLIENPEVGSEFQQGIEQLDSMYTSLKEELYQGNDSEKIMDAMIQNLQTRIEILNRQLEILKRIKELKNEKTNKNEDTYSI